MSSSPFYLTKSPRKKPCVVASCHVSNNFTSPKPKPRIILHKGKISCLFSKTPALRNAQRSANGTLVKLHNNPSVPEKPRQSHQNCERLRPGGLSPEIKASTLCHLATYQAVVLGSEINVTFDLHKFSFTLSLSNIWVTNPYPQHGDTTNLIIHNA
jgi:hypothetical protein